MDLSEDILMLLLLRLINLRAWRKVQLYEIVNILCLLIESGTSKQR